MMQINEVLDSWFNKGFRGPKCKTLLKLATSRVKLLRNKRVIHLKQLRRELAQLLENGQESTAHIRVEHIIREQNIMEAYDILELFCELLIVRMPIIESQRECPLDLQEAVASLIFAAPRASDLPELLAVQNMLSFKYEKDFVEAATELRPGCNVNRLVIEKLSAAAPARKVKVHLMKEIAEEHDIEWDSASMELEFSKPPEDLLDGPNHFIGPIQMSPIPHDEDDLHADQLKLDSSFQEQGSSLPSPPKGKLSTHLQSVDPIEKPKFVPFIVPPPKYGTGTMASRFYSPPRESSITQQSGLLEETLLQRSHSRTKSEGSMNLQDIIEAAEAAAESAEQAARAARAAADLARSRISPRDIKHEAAIPQVTSETDQDIPSVFELNSKADTGSEKTNIHLTPDSYDWTQEYKGKKHPEKEVAHVDHRVEGKGHPDGDGGSSFDEYGENNDAYDSMQMSYDHQPSMKGESPFLEDGNFFSSDRLGHGKESEGGHQHVYDAPSFDGAGTASYPEPFQRLPSLDAYDSMPTLYDQPSMKGESPFLEDGKFFSSDRLGHGKESEGGHQPVYDAPSFDGAGTASYPEPFRRLPSLEDDPYYTYPNLFSKPSSGSTFSS